MGSSHTLHLSVNDIISCNESAATKDALITLDLVRFIKLSPKLHAVLNMIKEKV